MDWHKCCGQPKFGDHHPACPTNKLDDLSFQEDLSDVELEELAAFEAQVEKDLEAAKAAQVKEAFEALDVDEEQTMADKIIEGLAKYGVDSITFSDEDGTNVSEFKHSTDKLKAYAEHDVEATKKMQDLVQKFGGKKIDHVVEEEPSEEPGVFPLIDAIIEHTTHEPSELSPTIFIPDTPTFDIAVDTETAGLDALSPVVVKHASPITELRKKALAALRGKPGLSEKEKLFELQKAYTYIGEAIALQKQKVEGDA